MSENILLTDNLDMLHSLYDFKATYAKTLTFKTNEYFILNNTNTKHKNWWEVINDKGEIGYIPSNYVETMTVNPNFYQKFINDAIQCLKNDENLINSRSNIISKLQTLQKNANEILNKELNDKHFETKSCCSSCHSSLKDEPSVKLNDKSEFKEILKKSNENLHKNIISSNSPNTVDSPTINHTSVFDLIENVRINTQLSHEMSRVAVSTVIEGLHELLPASVFPYLSTILSQVQINLVDDIEIDQTHDASRLRTILNDLTSAKEDAQQRSWSVHEDEMEIKENLTELISILSNADASISRHVISFDEYHYVITLIQFYQMEVRWSIRQLLLQSFGVLCSLEKTVVTIMLNSILPGELARDMMSNPINIPKLNYSSILLTMIFSMGEPMPFTHYDILNKQFASFLLDNIEDAPETDVNEQIPDLFLNCLISFNLQFEDYGENPLLNALEEKDVAKIFTEKILLLLNREHDPIRIFEHIPTPPHSVLKLFNDVFSRRSTADLFYTNDIKVLIDIVVRNISDLSPGDNRRLQYIELCRRVIRNTNYNEHHHKLEELLKCFARIFCEENDLSKNDQKIVREISHEFPNLFN